MFVRKNALNFGESFSSRRLKVDYFYCKTVRSDASRFFWSKPGLNQA